MRRAFLFNRKTHPCPCFFKAVEKYARWIDTVLDSFGQDAPDVLAQDLLKNSIVDIAGEQPAEFPGLVMRVCVGAKDDFVGIDARKGVFPGRPGTKTAAEFQYHVV